MQILTPTLHRQCQLVGLSRITTS